MKKFVKFLPVMLVAILASVMFWSCDNDDDEKTLSETELPAAARTFISTYYPSAKIVTVTKEGSEFDVDLDNGHSVDFNAAGEWIDVDAPYGAVVPKGFYPDAIDQYLAANMQGTGVNEISKEAYGFEVETVSGIDLKFSASGDFLSSEKDMSNMGAITKQKIGL